MVCYLPLEETEIPARRGHERRRQERLPISQSAKMTIMDDGNPVEIPVTLVDISRQGLGLVAPCTLSLGQTVRIQTEDLIVFGSVRHSRRADEQFRVGIEVDTAVTRRNRYTMRPSITGFVPL